MDHLREDLLDFVQSASDADRIEKIKSHPYIGYERADIILRKFNDLLTYPKCSRMPNILLVGESGIGKTFLLEKFIKNNPSYIDDSLNELVTPVLFIEAPFDMTENSFYDEIFRSTHDGIYAGERTSLKKIRAINILETLKVKVIVIDEIHNLLSGTARKQRMFLNLVKYFSNTLRISMIFSGTRDALNAISTDPQIMSRFEKNELTKWTVDKHFLILLASFEEVLPLKEKSMLKEPGLALKILTKSEGLTGEVVKILKLSAIMAIESGSEKITKRIVDSIDYTSLSKNRW